MQMTKDTKDPTQFIIRAFKPGEEGAVVDFLNMSYPGGWGTREDWDYLCSRSPFLGNDNMFVVEHDGHVVGYRGFELVRLMVRGSAVPIALLHDTAIHPEYRGFGLYGNLHRTTLAAAKAQGACLADAGNSRGSITYNHNRKTGFVEIKGSRTYIRPLNYEEVVRTQAADFFTRREEVQSMLQGLDIDLYVCVGETDIALQERPGGSAASGVGKGWVRLVLSRDSFPWLVGIASGGRMRKARSVLALLLGRKMKVRASSPLALGKAAWTMMRIVRRV